MENGQAGLHGDPRPVQEVLRVGGGDPRPGPGPEPAVDVLRLEVGGVVRLG